VFAERIRKNVNVLKLEIDLQLTVSIGAASLNLENGIDLATFIKQADDAVYKAKNQGRNQVVSA
jgi:diguanylate cyclase (GGDEF)-like protein